MSLITFDLSRTSRDPGWNPDAAAAHDALWRQFAIGASYAFEGSAVVQTAATTAGQGLTFESAQGDASFKRLAFADGGGSIGTASAATPAIVTLDWINPASALLRLDSAWNAIKNAEVSQFTGTALRIENFVDAWVHLEDDVSRSITLDGAKRGEVITGGGADIITIGIDTNNSGWTNEFLVSSGAGNDVITFRITQQEVVSGAYQGQWTETTTYAEAGDDTVFGWGSNDFVDGGTGTDVFMLRGLRAGYDITMTAGITTILDINTADGNDGRDTLVNVEQIRFRDGSVFNLVPPNLAPVAVDDALSVQAAAPDTLLPTVNLTADLLSNDRDPEGLPLTISAVGAVSLGTVTLSAGSVLFSMNGAAYQALGAGQQASGSFTYTIRDAGGLTATATATVVVTGVNDAASITGPSTDAVTEDGTLSAAGTLTVADADAGEARFAVPASLAGSHGSFSFNASTGAWGYTLANTAANVQALAAGQTVIDSLTVSSMDGTASQAITVSIAGSDDAASISGTAAGTMAEDGALTAGGTLVVQDADAGQASFAQPALLAGSYGSFNFDATTGVWGYTLNNAAANVQALGAGQMVTDSLLVTSLDGSANQAVTVTIAGSNDASVISGGGGSGGSGGGGLDGAVGEDGILSANSQLVVVDPDLGESGFAIPISLLGTYGGFAFDATTGAWGYWLNNAAANVQGLAGGQSLTDTLTVTSLDGSASRTLVVSIAGVNDAATITGTSTGALAEDGTLSASGTLSVTDVDAGEAAFAMPAALAGSYGSFSFDAATGAWGYTLANAAVNVQALAAGQAVTDSLTVSSLDGTASQAITVSVAGSNDAASITGTSTGALAEDGTLSASGTLTITDVDAGQASLQAPSSLAGSYGSFSFNAATGAWGYALNNAAANVQALAAGQTVTDSLAVTSLDGTASQAITVSIAGRNDAAVIGGAVTGAVTENGTIAAGGTLTITDVDNGQATFQVPTSLSATYGSFSFNASSGVWGYALNNAAANVQALRAGQSVSDRLTVASLDGATSQMISVTVTGAANPHPIAPVSLAAIATGTSNLGFKILGEGTDEWAAQVVSGGEDINGDGRADLIVGGRHNSSDGSSNNGGAYVVFGKSGGATVDLDSIVTGTSSLGFKILGEATEDNAGYGLSRAGDVNGDGRADIVIGALYNDNDASTDNGAAYVVFGKSSGTTVDLDDIATGISTLGFKVLGESSDNYAGYSVAQAGDVNSDGRADIIIGAHSNDSDGSSDNGAAYVVFGKVGGGTIDLDDVATGTSSLGFKILGEVTANYLGTAVSGGGDINGDGLSDVIVSGIWNDSDGANNNGAVYVVFGKAGGATVNLDALATGTSGQGFKILGESSGDEAGSMVSIAGDVNGDGRADIILGASWNDSDGSDDNGAAYVVFGKGTGSVIDLDDIASGSSTLGFKILGESTDDRLGLAVSNAGDLNGDGLADLLVGAPWHSTPGYSHNGAAYVVFGKTSGGTVDLDAIAAGGSVLGFKIFGEVDDDTAARSVSAAGDVNGDGLADLIVGAVWNDSDGSSDNGAAYVIYGQASWLF